MSNASEMAEARACGRRFGRRAYDAAYLALTLRREAPIAALDRQLIEAAAAVGVGHLDPR